jgi:hypothetical protein
MLTTSTRGRARPRSGEDGDAVELRHRQIERDDVRIELRDARERVVAVARGADDVDLAARAQQARQDLARERGVVDHEHARAPRHGALR